MLNGFRIRSVAAVSQPDLEILTVEAACARLVGELMPVGSYDTRILKAAADIVFVGGTLAILVVGGYLSRMEHSPVHSSEMKFP